MSCINADESVAGRVLVEAQYQDKNGEFIMKQCGFVVAASILLLTVSAFAQEVRNEVSAQGTGFFTKDSSNDGIRQSSTNTGGFLLGYRYHFNKWLAAEANYGFDRNTQKYFLTSGFSRVQSDIHTTTADLVVNVPVKFFGLRPYVLGGSGALTFHPTGNEGGAVPGADTQAKAVILYGGGADFGLTRHLSLRAEYRGYIYKTPDFGVRSLTSGGWTHTAQPSAGIAYSF